MSKFEAINELRSCSSFTGIMGKNSEATTKLKFKQFCRESSRKVREGMQELQSHQSSTGLWVGSIWDYAKI